MSAAKTTSATEGANEWVRYWRAPNQPLEAMHAYFRAHRYHPHSHETYSFGVTDVGVQAFRCRGVEHASTTGMVMAFNPDEPHDGHAGAEPGFVYRIAHIGEELVRNVLGDAAGAVVGRPLFREPLVNDVVAAEALRRLFASLFEQEGQLERDERLAGAVLAMARHSAGAAWSVPRRSSLTGGAVERVREVLEDEFARDIGAEELAEAAGCSRYAMYRAFTGRYGLAPSDYQRQRRLPEARRLLREGTPPAAVASAVGFADQSHLNRWFVRSFGITPGTYRRSVG